MREREKMAPKRKLENEVLQENNGFQAENKCMGGTAIMALKIARTTEELIYLSEQRL